MLTVNVIVFGVDDEALPAIVTNAWSRATGAETAWRLSSAAPAVPPAGTTKRLTAGRTRPAANDGGARWAPAVVRVRSLSFRLVP